MACYRKHDDFDGSYELAHMPRGETPIYDQDRQLILGQSTLYKTATKPSLAQKLVRLLMFWKPKHIASVSKRQIPLRLGGEPLLNEQTNRPYVSNRISTARYTIWSFVPRQLIYQFSRMANAYFLTIAILQTIPGFSTTGQFSTLIPLMLFVALTMAKEGYDDWCRYQLDKEENRRLVKVLRREDGLGLVGGDHRDSISVANVHLKPSSADEDWKTIRWEEIVVGDVVRLSKDENVPADMVLLHADRDVAYIDTRALDGETTLKSKVVSPALKGLDFETSSVSTAIGSSDALFTIELPNQDLYNFDGTVAVNGGDSMPLNVDNVIYRGCELKNTKYIIGLALNTVGQRACGSSAQPTHQTLCAFG